LRSAGALVPVKRSVRNAESASIVTVVQPIAATRDNNSCTENIARVKVSRRPHRYHIRG